MSLSASLERLVEQSTKAASVQITTPLSETVRQFAGMKRPLYRNAEPHECRLFAVSTGDSLSAKFQADLQNVQTLQRVISTANTLSQLCNRPELKRRIEELALRYEELQVSNEYLHITLQRYEEEASREKASTHKRRRAEEREPEAAVLQRYEREVHEIQDELDTKNSILSQHQDEMHLLEERIAAQRKQLQDQEEGQKAANSAKKASYPEPVRSKNTGQKRAPNTSSVYDALYAQLADLQDAEPGQDHLDASECNELVTLLDQASDTLQDVMEDISKLQSSSDHHSEIINIQQKLLAHVLSESSTFSNDTTQSVASLFPDEATEAYQPPTQAKVIAKVLQTLEKEQGQDGMPLATLKEQISQYAESIGLDDKAATQGIYNLVAKNAIVIDRSSNSSLVKHALYTLPSK